MGSRVSILSGSESISGPPRLPFDIVLEILSHLRTAITGDRETILALALCCRVLRDASQRILFGRMHHGYLDTTPGHVVHTMKVHSKFLRTVVKSPQRLALYVLSYSQHALALDPRFQSTAKELTLGHRKTHVRVWMLTEQALPLMVNLKHLKFTPLIHRPSNPVLLRRCRFQLESFIWAGIGSEHELFTNFLPTQRQLLHLNINAENYSDRPGLPDGLCPTITSITCSLSDLRRVSATRNIIAFQFALGMEDRAQAPGLNVNSAAGRDACVTALKKILFLRLWALPQFHQLTGGVVLHNITLLQVRYWRVEDMDLLTQLPNLRSLRLWNPYPSNIDTSIHRNTALCAFNKCPKLEGVLVFASPSPPILVWRFMRQPREGVHEELIPMDDYIDSVWWKVII